MKALTRVLKPGGLIVAHTPDAACLERKLMGPRWRKFNIREHLHYFSPHNLSLLFDRYGLSSVKSSLFERTLRPWLIDTFIAIARKPETHQSCI